MKNLILTIMLLTAAATASAQKFDMFMAGGLYTDKPTKGEYLAMNAYNMWRNVAPKRSNGYYFGLGGEVTFGKKLLHPGIRLEVDYISYLLLTEEYFFEPGKAPLPTVYPSYNMQYVRLAPAFTLSRSLAGIRAAVAAGPVYNFATTNYSNYLGAQVTVSGGYKGIMLNLGYTYGFSTMHEMRYEGTTQLSSRAIFLGLSLYPQRFKK